MNSESVTVTAMNIGLGRPYMMQVPPPLAPDNRLFILEAIGLAGAILEGDGWKNWEKETLNYPDCVPPYQEPKLFLRRLPPPKIPPSLGSSRVSRPEREEDYQARRASFKAKEDKLFSDYKEANEEEKKLHASWVEAIPKHAAGIAAIKRTFLDISRKIINGKITAYSRPVSGGVALTPVNPAFFMSEGLVDFLPRIGSITISKLQHYIFLDRGEFAQEFDPSILDQPSIEGVSMDSLSPHLRLLIAVALSKIDGPDCTEATDALASEMIARAPEFGLTVGGKGQADYDISLSQCQKLAPALRWPKARAGRASQRGGKRKT